MKKEKVEKAREKRKDTHLNAEFLRIARRDKKAFLSDQSKEIEGTSLLYFFIFLFALCHSTPIHDKNSQ